MIRSIRRGLFLSLFLAFAPLSFYAQQGDTTTAAHLIEEGRRFYFRGLYPEAIARYHKALERAPQNATALYELAWAYFDIGEHTKSLEAATEASLHAPALIEKIYALISRNYYFTMNAATYEVELNERKAEDVLHFRKMARTAQDGDERLFKLGLTYTTRNQLAPAITAYVEALQVRPDYADVHWELGRCFEHQEKFSLAAMAYVHALLNAPENVFADRVLTMLENSAPRLIGDTGAVYTTPLGSPETLVHTLQQLVARPDAASIADTLSCNHYLPWFKNMLDSSYQEVVANYIYQAVDNQKARTWIQSNGDQLHRFLEWSRTFPWANAVERTQEEQ